MALRPFEKWYHETIFKWVIVFLLSSCESYLCVLDVGALSHIWYVHIFSASSWFSVYFNSVLQEAKVFHWMKFRWWGFLVWIRHVVYLRSLCPSQDCQANFPMFLSRIFIVWVLMLWSVSQSFELMCMVCGPPWWLSGKEYACQCRRCSREDPLEEEMVG